MCELNMLHDSLYKPCSELHSIAKHIIKRMDRALVSHQLHREYMTVARQFCLLRHPVDLKTLGYKKPTKSNPIHFHYSKSLPKNNVRCEPIVIIHRRKYTLPLPRSVGCLRQNFYPWEYFKT